MREPYGKRLPPVQPGWRLAALAGWICLACSGLLAQDRRESVLDVLVEEYSLNRADTAQALRILRGKDPKRILIGFESVSGPDSRPVLLPDLHLRNQTVGQILRRLCREDARYAFELPGDPRIVNVYLKSTRNSASNLLNLRITRFEVDGPVFPQNLIRSIDSYAPELREFLHMKRTREKAPAAPPGASPGSILSGDVPAHRVSLHLRNVTVREILNAIVLYTSDQQSALGFSFPLSWHYEFFLDPAGSTGLGGLPRWDIF